MIHKPSVSILILRIGYLYFVTTRAISANTFWHSFYLPANILNHALYSPDFDEIIHHIPCGRSSRREIRLDDCSAKCSTSLDWTHTESVTSCEHEDGMWNCNWTTVNETDQSRALHIGVIQLRLAEAYWLCQGRV